MIPVQDVRVEIDAVRPTDRSGDTVHRRPSERRVVIDRGQNPGKLAHEVELPHQSVRERHTKRAGAEVLDIGYSGERGHNHRLLEGLDRGQGGRLLRRQPVVRYQFVVMERLPLLAHASRSSGPGSPSLGLAFCVVRTSPHSRSGSHDEAGNIGEHAVIGDQFHTESLRGDRDPTVGLVDLLAKRVTSPLALGSQLGARLHS